MSVWDIHGGSGTFPYKIEDYPFSASGLTLTDVGGGQNVVTAEVYKPDNVEEFAGAYSAAQAAGALVRAAGSDISRIQKASS